MRAFTTALAAALAVSAQAALKITTPSTDKWWVANSVNNIEWNCGNGNPTTYTVLIANPDVKLLTATQAIIAIENDYICSQSFTPGSTVPAGKGYTILLANPLNSTEVYATSETFEVKPAGSTYPAQVTPGSGAPAASGSAGASGSPSSTASGSGAAPSPTRNSAIRNGASALLAIAGIALGVTVA